MPRDSTAATFEQCADDLSEFINTLDRYPHTLLAFALRAHLSALLQALVGHSAWTYEEAETFLRDMQEETLHPDSQSEEPNGSI